MEMFKKFFLVACATLILGSQVLCPKKEKSAPSRNLTPDEYSEAIAFKGDKKPFLKRAGGLSDDKNDSHGSKRSSTSFSKIAKAQEANKKIVRSQSLNLPVPFRDGEQFKRPNTADSGVVADQSRLMNTPIERARALSNWGLARRIYGSGDGQSDIATQFKRLADREVDRIFEEGKMNKDIKDELEFNLAVIKNKESNISQEYKDFLSKNPKHMDQMVNLMKDEKIDFKGSSEDALKAAVEAKVAVKDFDDEISRQEGVIKVLRDELNSRVEDAIKGLKFKDEESLEQLGRQNFTFQNK